MPLLALTPTLPEAMLWAWAGSALLMTALWLHQVRTRNATLVDVGWTLSVMGSAWWYQMVGAGSTTQRLLAAGIAAAWGLRLSVHLVRDRVLGGKPEDTRYQALRAAFAPREHLHFFWFYQLQAVVAVFLSLPYAILAYNTAGVPNPTQWIGVGICALAFLGVWGADRQLAAWRGDPANRGKTCRAGLWRYSRHPNYFFEWTFWIGLALVATPAPMGGWGWTAPAAMLVLVTKVSGIPWAEKQALRSRGEDYRRYQRETSPFIPWVPRRPAG